MALAQKHFQPRALTHHYINMAKVTLSWSFSVLSSKPRPPRVQKHDRLYFENKGAADEVSLKKYFYIIRPLMGVEVRHANLFYFKKNYYYYSFL
jgi:predicted nucleotidyltransferase